MILAVSAGWVLGGYIAGMMACAALVLAWCARWRP